MANTGPSELVIMLLVLLGLAALVGLMFAGAEPQAPLQPAHHHAAPLSVPASLPPALLTPAPLPPALLTPAPLPPALLTPAPLHPASHALPAV
ncbi:MAG: hypothetical protein AAGE13_07120 [Pseudomonadota bacterium]